MIQFAYLCVIGKQLFHGLSRTYVSWTLQNPKLLRAIGPSFSFSLLLLLSEERVVGVGVMVCVWGGGGGGRKSFQILERDVRLKKETKNKNKKKKVSSVTGCDRFYKVAESFLFSVV